MASRQAFNDLLNTLQEGTSVYFQPPNGTKINYPAIVYNDDFEAVEYADNLPYLRTSRYMVTIMDSDPDSVLKKLVGDLPMSKFVRHYTVANLNHTVFNVYFLGEVCPLLPGMGPGRRNTRLA
jgi:hypothetical protein